MSYTSEKEGSLKAPVRHSVNWKTDDYYDRGSLNKELERVFDICHTCRRCVSLCNAFPTLFDLIDESDTMEVDGVPKDSYKSVVDECYLCDLCYMTKCPYVPPHEWDVDFPHLMLRAKAANFKEGKTSIRDKALTSTVNVGKIVGLPVIAESVNALNDNATVRTLMEKFGGIHSLAPLPRFERVSFMKRRKERSSNNIKNDHDLKSTLNTSEERLNLPAMSREDLESFATANGSTDIRMEDLKVTDLKIALFVTCYGNYNAPKLVEDMVEVFAINEVNLKIVASQNCCGMPKFELGDLRSVERFKNKNIGEMSRLVQEGYKITAPIPSCVLMYRKELPLLFPRDENVRLVSQMMIDPFELLMQMNKESLLNVNFVKSLGKVAYHAPCHQRVQNIGPKTKEVLELVPDSSVALIERCSGHDGTYGVKKESYPFATKICRPVVKAIKEFSPDFYISDCPMAFDLIAQGVGKKSNFKSAFAALKYAYGVES